MTEETKRKVGRPRKEDKYESRTRERSRTPVGGYRDKLSVMGMDSNYAYRWVLSSDTNAGRILDLQDRGYEFVDSSTHSFGQSNVYKTEDGSSLIRVPAGKNGDFLYLMRIKKEWFEEDQKDKSKRIMDEYEAVKNYSEAENAEERGVYGKFEIK